jgi:hypothetical protein
MTCLIEQKDNFSFYLCLALSIVYLSNPFSPTASVVWWSEFLATDPEARVRFPALPDFLEKKKRGKTVVGLERGPLSLLSTTEELLDRKVAALV